MKNIKLNSLIILLLSLFFIIFVLKDNLFETIQILKNADGWWIVLAIIIYLVHLYVESLALFVILSQKEKQYSFVKILKLQIMTKFFNGITPFASGGQPLQVYELKKENIPVYNGAIIIVENFILFQTAIMILGLSGVIINKIFHLFKFDPIITNLFILGFIINAIILIVVYSSSISESLNKKIAKMITFFLIRMKIVKDKEKKRQQLDEFFRRYYQGFLELRRNKKLVIKAISLQVLSLCLLFLVPQLVFNGLNVPHELNIISSIVAGTYVFITGSFVPIPGGTVGIEFAFLCFYANFVPKELMPPALIMWRFITYYAPMVAGAFVYNLFPNAAVTQKEA